MHHSITNSSWGCSKLCAEERSESSAKSNPCRIHCHISASCSCHGVWPQVLVSKNFCHGDLFYMGHITLRETLSFLHCLQGRIQGCSYHSDALQYRNCGPVPGELDSGMVPTFPRVQHGFTEAPVICPFERQITEAEMSFIATSSAPMKKVPEPPFFGN